MGVSELPLTPAIPRNHPSATTVALGGGSAPDARRLSVPGGLLAAKGKYGLKLELTDDALRYVIPGRPAFSYRGEVVVPISAIVDVYWTDPFLKVGDGVFGIVAPGALPAGIWPGERGRAGALFGRGDLPAFRAIYDVLLSVVLEARGEGADMVTYLLSSDPTPMTAPGIPGTQVQTGLRIGDVNAQFDIQTEGRITGSLRHEYLGRFGSMDFFGGDLHLGGMALIGSSTVDLSTTATARANLLSPSLRWLSSTHQRCGGPGDTPSDGPDRRGLSSVGPPIRHVGNSPDGPSGSARATTRAAPEEREYSSHHRGDLRPRPNQCGA